MKMNMICEVNAALYTLVMTKDNSLHAKILSNINNSLTPDGVFLADFTKTVASMKLICLFGEEQEVIDAANQLEADFPNPAFNIIGAFTFAGLQHGLSYDEDDLIVGNPTYQYAINDLMKYVDGNETDDPFWRTSDFNKRILV